MRIFCTASAISLLSLLFVCNVQAGEPVGGINVSLEQIPPGQVDIGGPTSEIPALPAGFFDPGSLPFEGTIPLRGRTTAEGLPPGKPVECWPLDFPGAQQGAIGSSIPIEMVELSLRSVDPIDVPNSDGTVSSWDIHVSITAPAIGQLQLTQEPGGNFIDGIVLDIDLRLEFSPAGSPPGSPANPVLIRNLGATGMDGFDTTLPPPPPPKRLSYHPSFPGGPSPGFVPGSDGTTLDGMRMVFGDGSFEFRGVATPEPTSLVLLGLGALAMMRRRIG